MKKYLRKWQIQSSNGDKFYTVALDTDGNYSCSCPQWVYRRQECKHIKAVKEIMPNGDYYLAELAKWRNAIIVHHINGIWDELYELAKKIDIENVAVTLKMALENDTIDEIDRVISELGLPDIPYVRYKSAINLEEMFDLTNKDKRLNKTIVSVKEAFEQKKSYEIAIKWRGIRLVFILKHKEHNYTPTMIVDAPSEIVYYSMITPTIIVSKPQNMLVKSLSL